MNRCDGCANRSRTVHYTGQRWLCGPCWQYVFKTAVPDGTLKR